MVKIKELLPDSLFLVFIKAEIFSNYVENMLKCHVCAQTFCETLKGHIEY